MMFGMGSATVRNGFVMDLTTCWKRVDHVAVSHLNDCTSGRGHIFVLAPCEYACSCMPRYTSAGCGLVEGSGPGKESTRTGLEAEGRGLAEERPKGSAWAYLSLCDILCGDCLC